MSYSEQAPASERGERASQPRVSRLASVYVARTDKAHSWSQDIDQLDGLMLSCASTELSLDALLEQVPCSKRAGLDRVRRLTELGLLTIHRASEAPGVVPMSAPPAPEPVVHTPAPAHRVFRKPKPE
jgi:hypothetical protein